MRIGNQKFEWFWENDWRRVSPGWYIRPIAFEISLGNRRYFQCHLVVLGLGFFFDTWEKY